MDKELKRIEKELQSLIPRQPGKTLKSGIADEISVLENIIVHNFWKRTLLAAASIAILAGLSYQYMYTPSNTEIIEPNARGFAHEVTDTYSFNNLDKYIFRPKRIQTALLSSEKSIINTPDSSTLNCETRQILDHIEWVSLDGKRKITVTKPRREVLLTRLEAI